MARKPKKEEALGGFIVIAILIWVFIVNPIVEWIKSHVFLSILIFIGLPICVVIGYFYFRGLLKKG